MSESQQGQPSPGPRAHLPALGSPQCVVILGASVAGLRAAITLDRLLIGRREHRIILFDRNPFHQVRPLLSAVAGGSLGAESATVPVERLLGARRIEFHQARVEAVNLASHTVQTSGGSFEYGWVVAALGVESGRTDVPGLAEIAAELWTVDDARRLNERIVELIRQAAWKLDSDERTRLSTIVVIGGSRFGVELAGALGERMRALASRFRLPEGDGRVVLVESSDRLLPADPRGLGDAAGEALARLGVEVRLGSAIVRASSGGVELGSGETIGAGLIVRTSPGRAPSFLSESGAIVGRDGRLVVDRELRLPEYPHAYAAGPGITLLGDVIEREDGDRDAARQGEVAAHNVAAEIGEAWAAPMERLPYKAELGDVVIPIGARDGVGQVRGLTVAGWRARMALEASRLAYFESIGGAGGLLAGLSRRPAVGKSSRR